MFVCAGKNLTSYKIADWYWNKSYTWWHMAILARWPVSGDRELELSIFVFICSFKAEPGVRSLRSVCHVPWPLLWACHNDAFIAGHCTGEGDGVTVTMLMMVLGVTIESPAPIT